MGPRSETLLGAAVFLDEGGRHDRPPSGGKSRVSRLPQETAGPQIYLLPRIQHRVMDPFYLPRRPSSAGRLPNDKLQTLTHSIAHGIRIRTR